MSMKASVLVAVACAGYLACATGAKAEPLSFHAFRSGNWQATVHFNEKDQTFSHCAMNASYKSGTSVFFAIDRQMKWRIGFSNDSWNLIPKENYAISYVIDSFPVNTASARAYNKTLAIAELPATSQVFQQFRVGRMLVVRAGDALFNFALEGTSRALSNLLDCATAGKLRTAADYRTGGSSRAADAAANTDRRVSQEHSAEEKLEATQLVANLLSTGELRDSRILTSSEIAKADMPDFVRTAAVAWTGPSSLGVLHVVPDGAGNIDTLVANVIGGDAGACKGTFASGKIPDAELPKVRRVFTTCSGDSKNSSHIEYIYVPRPNGSVYRFTIVALFFDGTPKHESSGLREAIKKAAFDQ